MPLLMCSLIVKVVRKYELSASQVSIQQPTPSTSYSCSLHLHARQEVEKHLNKEFKKKPRVTEVPFSRPYPNCVADLTCYVLCSARTS